jgi:hypothetical protein
MTSEVENVPLDYESEIDGAIDAFFASKGVLKDLIELEEKKLIVRELALANKKSEIVPKLNELRRSKNLPELQYDFDIFYYAREYAELIEDISSKYALNLAKKYRFANRVTRIAKLNEVAESVLDRIHGREGRGLSEREEGRHNDNIKIFAQLLNAVDEQMGKLKMTKIDVNINRGEQKAQLDGAVDFRKMIEETLRRYSSQLPAAVDANFTDITDYGKCQYGEEWSATTHCKYHNEQCKVQTGELTKCPVFLNKILLGNKEWLSRRYANDRLSRRQIAELAGCKEIDDRAIDVVTGKLKELGLYRSPEPAA